MNTETYVSEKIAFLGLWFAHLSGPCVCVVSFKVRYSACLVQEASYVHAREVVVPKHCTFSGLDLVAGQAYGNHVVASRKRLGILEVADPFPIVVDCKSTRFLLAAHLPSGEHATCYMSL